MKLNMPSYKILSAAVAVILTSSLCLAEIPSSQKAEVPSVGKSAKVKKSAKKAKSEMARNPQAEDPVSASPSKIYPHSLPQIDLDQWTKALWQKDLKRLGRIYTDVKAPSMVDVASQSQSAAQVYKGIVAANQDRKLTNGRDYLELADAVMYARQSFRSRLDLENTERRRILFLVEIMAEEVLYVGHLLFASELKTYQFNWHSNPDGDSRIASLRGILVRNGDVIVSKATGSGSSSFIATSMDGPNLYSHSTPAYVEPKTNRLLSPEAFIEDGVKLRDAKADYLEGQKTRLSVYRYFSSSSADEVKTHELLSKSVDAFVEEMRKKTGADDSKAAYSYDFQMNPLNAKDAYFCSGVAYKIYRDVFAGEDAAGAENSHKNPYSVSNWSTISDGRASLYQILNIKTKAIPAPSDIELNPNYELVGMQIAIEKLQQERIEFGILDTFMQVISQNPELVKKYADKLDKFGNQPITAQQIELLQKQKLLPVAITGKLGEIPENANLKQLAFFFYMNEVMTPKLRDKIMKLENQRISGDPEQAAPFGLIEIRTEVLKEVVEGLHEMEAAGTKLVETAAAKAKAVGKGKVIQEKAGGTQKSGQSPAKPAANQPPAL